MITEYMEENDMFDINWLIPTNEEMEETIKHITETGVVSFDDAIVLYKMKLCKIIIDGKGYKI